MEWNVINALSGVTGTGIPYVPGTLPFDQDDSYHSSMLPSRRGSTISRANLQEFINDLADFEDNSTIEQGLQKLGIPDLQTPLPGMKTTLMPHQVLGVSWMKEREESKDRGGILADEMATLICITVKYHHLPLTSKTSPAVAPNALLTQWASEIELHTDGRLNILIYHGAAKKKHTTTKSLEKYDVVITTYMTVALEKPTDSEVMERLHKRKKKNKKDDFIASDSEADSEDEEDSKKKRKQDGPLINFPWFRIILDEAQNIRNHKTRASKVVCELDAHGTPITNGLHDTYAFFVFLHIRPWCDWTEFREKILPRGSSGDYKKEAARLCAIFKKILLRRKKDSELDGRPLIQLPKKTKIDLELIFSPEELQTYESIKSMAQAIFNRFLKEGTVLKNYHHVFVMLLRLRQICVHPSLIAEHMDVFRTPDEINSVKEREALNEVIGRARREQGQEFLDRMFKIMKDYDDARMEAEESLDAKIEEDPCLICHEPLMEESTYATACCHFMCEECLKELMESPHVVDSDDPKKYSPSERPCPACRSAVSKQHSYLRAAFQPFKPITIEDSDDEMDNKPYVKAEAKDEQMDVDDDDGETSIMAPGRRTVLPRASKMKARKAIKPDPENDSGSDFDDYVLPSGEDDEDDENQGMEKAARFVGRKTRSLIGIKRKAPDDNDEDEDGDGSYASEAEESDGDEEKPNLFQLSKELVDKHVNKPSSSFLTSTKTKQMMDLLVEWRQKYPGDKTMVVSQWTTVLHELCAPYLAEQGFGFVTFTGDLSLKQRDRAIANFRADPSKQVMLTLLVRLPASSVFENQAFDRVHRLGQRKEVEIYRLTIQNTVEARVLALQDRKQGLSDGCLGEGTVRRQQRLSVRELAALFDVHIC
ncbi:hypothetical protein DL93DRAFT_2077428 [Clavulina sp. PMI_390]|nr:hypothetical protein DL93DRAFT_2077428 [Clavulina sp. PMI_390]